MYSIHEETLSPTDGRVLEAHFNRDLESYVSYDTAYKEALNYAKAMGRVIAMLEYVIVCVDGDGGYNYAYVIDKY